MARDHAPDRARRAARRSGAASIPGTAASTRRERIFAAEGERDEVLEFLRLVGGRAVRPAGGPRRARAPRPARRGRALRPRRRRPACSTTASARRASAWANYERDRPALAAAEATCARWCVARFTRGNAVVWMTGRAARGPRLDASATARAGPAPTPGAARARAAGVRGRGHAAGSRSPAWRARSAALRARDARGRASGSTTWLRGERGLAYAPCGRLRRARRGELARLPRLRLPATTTRRAGAGGALAHACASSPPTAPPRRSSTATAAQSARARNDPDRLRGRAQLRTSRRRAAGRRPCTPTPRSSTASSRRVDAAAVAAAMDQVLGQRDRCSARTARPPPDARLDAARAAPAGAADRG